MLKILTGIDKSKGFREFHKGENTVELSGPAILADASRYLQISMSDILPKSEGFNDLKMPFIFIPVVNKIMVPVAGVSEELEELVPGIIQEIKYSRILEDMDQAVRAVDDFLEDPVPVKVEFDEAGLVHHKISGELSYYNLSKRYDEIEGFTNPWEGTSMISWFGQKLYICMRQRSVTRLVIEKSGQIPHENLLANLINYKYAFKRFGIKTISD